MNSRPTIDYYCCTDCESCVEICPEVFFRNTETRLIEVAELAHYPTLRIEKAMAICPGDCIQWET